MRKKYQLISILLIFYTAIACTAFVFFPSRLTWQQRLRYPFTNHDNQWLIDDHQLKTDNLYYNKKDVVEILSPVFRIDKLFPSMTGPANMCKFEPGKKSKPQLLWLTDYTIDVTDKTGKNNLSKDFMCHNNLDIDIDYYYQHWNLWSRNETFNVRFMTLTEGQTEIHLPEGFGIPIFSDDKISVNTQVLNHNIENPLIDVRHRIRMDYIRNENLLKSLKPLFKKTAYILAKVDTSKNIHSTSTQAGDCRPAMASIAYLSQEKDGKTYSGHWIIRNGPDTLRYNVTEMLELPFDTDLHFASVHVHPFCESLALRDITDDSILFVSSVKNYSVKTGIETIGSFSSTNGIKMYKNHQYEMICITNNTSGKEQDMMAVMILYLYDQEIDRILRRWK